MLKHNPSIAQKQVILFILIGIINTLFGYSVFSLFIYFGLHYILASLLSTLIGILFNFNTIGRVVFNSRDNSRIYRFFGIYAVLYLVNISFLKLESGLIDNMYINGALATIFTAGISFFLNKYIVFTRETL